MEIQTLDPQTEKRLLVAQKTEITEHLIYYKLSQSIKNSHNRDVLKRISHDELKHHNLCNHYTCKDVKPNKVKVWAYYMISRILGVTFGLKLMERLEEKAHRAYQELSESIAEADIIAQDEERHGKELIDLIDDERLKYSSDIIRGLNVAVVEITGALAGLTLAFQNSSLVMTTGLIIGIVMSLSLTSTEYLATKSGTGIKSPLKSAAYAGLANILTILFLLSPYFLFKNIYVSLGFMILNGIIGILIFAFYISVARNISARKTFLEMVTISLGIAALSFGIGILARELLDVHVSHQFPENLFPVSLFKFRVILPLLVLR